MKKQTKGLHRETTDKYYTHPQIVNLCMQEIKTHLNISKEDQIIEPSAGNGVFINSIKQLSNNHHFYDIEPDHPEIIQQDFLLFRPVSNQTIHIIGNPPFGRQSSTAIKFIKKSAEFAKTISFILPKSFKKESMQKSFPIHFHLLHESDLPEKSFLVNGLEYDVPCIFQIWEKREDPRIVKPPLEPADFQFVQKTENPHISVRRVGVYAGKIEKEIESKSIQSHYFIQFTNEKSIDENIESLKSIVFSHNNTVGPRSISKQELIEEFNKKI
jgi:predicted RNA methylase